MNTSTRTLGLWLWLALIHPCVVACGPVVIDVDLGGGGTGGQVDGTNETDDTTEGDGATGMILDSTGSTSTQSSSDGAESTSSGDGTESSSSGDSTTGDQAPCVLPHGETQSWCAAQREVAQVLGCRYSEAPEACYQAISAQYEVGDWQTVQAGDCSTSEDGPGCEPLYEACTLAVGPNDCFLLPDDTATSCVARAVAQGVDMAAATPWCIAMLVTYT